MQVKLNLEYEELRKAIEEILSSSYYNQIAYIESTLARQHQENQQGVSGQNIYQLQYDDPTLSGEDRAKVHDIFWDLIIEGLIRPGTGDGREFDLPFIHLTKKGLEHFKSK